MRIWSVVCTMAVLAAMTTAALGPIAYASGLENGSTSSRSNIESIVNEHPRASILKNARLMFPSLVSGYFIENKGQVENDQIVYYTSLGNLRIGFGTSAVHFVLEGANGLFVATRMDFVGARQVLPEARDEMPHRLNYFLGSSADRWRTDVRSFQEIVYRDLYSGINVIYRIDTDGLKYEFWLAPGVDSKSITMHYEGSVRLQPVGDELILHTPAGLMRDAIPRSYEIGGKDVGCTYVLKDASKVGFNCDGHDKSRTLVIDPLLFSTYLGGSENETALDLTLDASGNIYIAGFTSSNQTTFPVTPGAFSTAFNGGLKDGFIAKLNSTAESLIYATYIGGAGDDSINSISVDSSENVYAAGDGDSNETTFPITPGSFTTTYGGGASDAYVVKLNSTGNNLLFSTFFGGSGEDRCTSLAVDSSTNVYIGGYTSSNETTFPVSPLAFDQTYNGGPFDAFAAKLNETGSGLVYSTYLGGDADDRGNGLAISDTGFAYVVGDTTSNETTFPATPTAFDPFYNGNGDGFIAALNSTGGLLVYATYLGGGEQDGANSIVVDSMGNAYIAAYTSSNESTYPVTIGAYDATFGGDEDCAIAKLNETGQSLVFATYIGGSDSESCLAISIDTSGDVYASGYTSSNETTFPVSSGSFDTSFNGGIDGFVVKLNESGGMLLYSTYLGGAEDDSINAMALESSRGVMVAGTTYSNETTFPLSLRAHDSTFNGNSDSFVTLLSLTYTIVLETIPLSLTLELDTIPEPSPIVFQCEAGEMHTIFAPSPQVIGQTRYVFTNWSDGGGQNHTIICTESTNIMANFTTEFEVTIDTSPANQEIWVDYVNYTSPETFWWLNGSTHNLEANEYIFIDAETRLNFTSWSDGGARNHTYQALGPDTVVASYQTTEVVVTIGTLPQGLEFRADNITYSMDKSFWWATNSNHTLNVSSIQGSWPTDFYVFQSWSDGSIDENRTYTIGGPENLVAVYHRYFQVTVETDPTGLRYWVDDTEYTSTMNFTWAEGTLHWLNTTSPQKDPSNDTYYFVTWSDSVQQNHTVLANMHTTYRATFRSATDITFDTIPQGLEIEVDGKLYKAPYILECVPGSFHLIGAPSPQGTGLTRFIFNNWSDGGFQSHLIECSLPTTLTATFTAEHTVTVSTFPAGLDVVIDSSSMSAPQSFWWSQGSIHSLDVMTPQGGSSTQYKFVGWSDGGEKQHLIVVIEPESFIAIFETEHKIVIGTNPMGLQVQLDGNIAISPFSVWCVEGSSIALNAPSPQTLGTTRYMFSSWSDGGNQAHSISCETPMSYTATYLVSDYYVIIGTEPPGLTVTIDGTDRDEPFTDWWAAGSSHEVDVPSPQTIGTSIWDFTFWSDGLAKNHTVVADEPLTLIAVFMERQPPPPQPGDFTISVAPPHQSTTPGGTLTFLVNVTGFSGYNGPAVTVTLVNPPQGFAGACAPQIVAPTGTCTLGVAAGSTVSPGSYLLTVRGSNGTTSRTDQISISIVELPSQGDFSLTGPLGIVTVRQGGNVTTMVTVTFLNGFDGVVLLYGRNLPAGIGFSFSPANITASGSSTLTIVVSNTAQIGSHILTFVGSGEGLTRTASIQLNIEAAPTPPSDKEQVETVPIMIWGLIILLMAIIMVVMILPYMRQKTCPECGARTPSKAKFCHNCKHNFITSKKEPKPKAKEMKPEDIDSKLEELQEWLEDEEEL